MDVWLPLFKVGVHAFGGFGGILVELNMFLIQFGQICGTPSVSLFLSPPPRCWLTPPILLPPSL